MADQDKSLEELLAQFKGYKMSPEERRAQAISWAVGQAMRANDDLDEWELRRHAAEYYDRTRGE